MGYVTNALATIAASLAGRQLYDSGPTLSAWLIRRAARRLPTVADRERREEEWLAHLQDQPGLAGLYHAAGSLMASYRILLPFETTAIRLCLWCIYLGIELGLRHLVMAPFSKRLHDSAKKNTATQKELRAGPDHIIGMSANCIIMQLGRANLHKMDVDRKTLREMLSSFRPTK